MMWVLVVVAAHGSTATTQFSLADCNRNITLIETEGVKDAYCKSATSSDVIWFIKDGRRLIDTDAIK